MRPERVTRGEVETFLRAVGADPAVPCRIDVDKAQVTVTPASGEAVAVGVVDAPVRDGMVRIRHPRLDRDVHVPAGSEGQWAMSGWVLATDPPAGPKEPPEPPERSAPEIEQTDDKPARSRRKARESE